MSRFPLYTVDYISGVMSLRLPQKKSLEILDKIYNQVQPKKGMNLEETLTEVNNLYPICTDFEREFMSLAFSLATGVGKTRLMGAFITYLYTNHDIKNFFVVAPGTTIYEKLTRDLSDTNSQKYVFKGLGCFNNPPEIITGDDYRNKSISLFSSEVRIFVYNIDKFNKESSKMKQVNEMIGDSFYDYLSSLDDLVVIMDESHHYHADKGAKALDELKPLLGLELTATPLISKGNKQTPFKNVVYEYPLSKAIEDGYTRTPFAITRSDINFYNFGDEEIDKLMIQDGMICHERTKQELELFAKNHNERLVKPFVLIVCKDIEHATWVKDYITSDAFYNGFYRNKTLMVHSKQKASEEEAYTRLLLEVEQVDNPIEVVIHVDKLKEGWDVNNLYTIIPLRTASSKILREQMVGRGLRLPFGKRVGVKTIDAVMLTAHDKFDDLLTEANKGDSLFKAGNIIQVESIEKMYVEQTTLDLNTDTHELLEKTYQETSLIRSDEMDTLITKTKEWIDKKVVSTIQETKNNGEAFNHYKKAIIEGITEQLRTDDDLGKLYKKNQDPFSDWIVQEVVATYREATQKFIPIPQIRITDSGVEEYVFVDFNLDLTQFNHTPIQNDLIQQSLIDGQDKIVEHTEGIIFNEINPKKELVQLLRQKAEIDYERCKPLLVKLITQVCDHYTKQFGTDNMHHIIYMYKREIANEIYKQMMQHFYCENGFLQEEVVGERNYNIENHYNFTDKKDLYENPKNAITSTLFVNIKKGVFSTAKFDSMPELLLGRTLETDTDVVNWLRPASTEFNITYNRNRKYEPDFVVETTTYIYLVEVKGEDKLNDPDVVAKKKRAVQYCKTVSNWSKANGYKEWKHLFIPSQQIQANSSFNNLATRFEVTE
jgi:possible type III restriction protein res subunit